ncbi:MAG: carbon-nitrogen family hydrolase [Verrucomicrobia bacterium]|nr:carbon-nitrogen family hydrolase [Verrucomicrobiota bacterium]
MNVLLCQTEIHWEESAANHKDVQKLLSQQVVAPQSLIVLPEMFHCGFSMNVAGIAEEKEGASTIFLQSLARQYQSWVIGGITRQTRDGLGLNTAVAISPDGMVSAEYIKNHPFSLGGENAHFQAGHDVVVVEMGGFQVCPLICYDLRFPEIFRRGVDLGAEVFVVIANWPSRRVDHWTTLLRARAIENQAWVIGVNRAGSDPFHPYPGQSLVANPHGVVTAHLDHQPGILQSSIDTGMVHDWRMQFPALRDRKSS